MRKSVYCIVFLLCVIASPFTYATNNLTNTPNAVAAPHNHHPHLYTINANYGQLWENKQHHYLLILKHVHDQVSFSHHVPVKKISKNSSHPLETFIKRWQAKNTTQVEADITGIQVNNKTIGHTQFYANALLSDPQLDAKKDELTFQFTAKDTAIHIENRGQFENATVYINGCDLEKCTD